MFRFTDYIDGDELKTPYSCGLEETVFYLNWLDMFLDGYRLLSESEELTREEVSEQLRIGAEALRMRQFVSAGKVQDISKGISICNVAAMFGLSGFSFFCLLLAVAPEIDEKYSEKYRSLREDGENHFAPTFAFAESLYALIADSDELISVKASMNSIRACPLLRMYQSGDTVSSLRSGFTASRELTSLLKGDFVISGAMRVVCKDSLGEGELDPPLTALDECDKLRMLLNEPVDFEEKQLIHISGAEGSGRKFIIAHAVEDGNVLYVDMQKLLSLGAESMSECIREAVVRASVLGSTVVLASAKLGREEIARVFNILDFAFMHLSRIILTSDTKENMYELAVRYKYSHIEIPECKGSERKLVWEHYSSGFALSEDVSLERYASTYRFTPGIIKRCIVQAKAAAVSKGHSTIEKDDLQDAIRHFNSSKLSELAVFIPQKFTWDDIEIDEGQKRIMRLACARARLGGKVNEEWGFERKLAYGKGMSVLMYGPPGTGKTMAAQVMAREIGMDLYRVDLSQLVDKYIGETEKNIGKIFDCAKEGNFILFFDEADAMFSKRTDIESSNDKHANTETAYLLQKMEEYDGITFLATNRYNNFDDAFLRRLTYIVRLEMPDAATRLRLFESILPKDAPRSENIDLKFFADTFELTGSNIKNILYDAAFMAASEDAPIGNAHIVRALRHEFEKQKKMLSSADLGIYSGYLM